jgi:hypothetical protein
MLRHDRRVVSSLLKVVSIPFSLSFFIFGGLYLFLSAMVAFLGGDVLNMRSPSFRTTDYLGYPNNNLCFFSLPP